MRLAISNIAWSPVDDEAVAALLNRLGVDAIDIAPGKYFPDPAKATSADIAQVRAVWRERGIELTGMQALLFGTTGLNVFGPPESQASLLRHLEAVCRIGGESGATRLVFGSPKNRDRSGLSDEEALEQGAAFFEKVGRIAAGHGVTVCLEPNPERYGANFMTGCDETARVVARVAHPNIRMQFDTGALAINGEDPHAVLASHADLIGHVHASEPDLVPLGDGGTDHAAMAAALRARLPDSLVSIEMVETRNEPPLQAIERAVRLALLHYGDSAR